MARMKRTGNRSDMEGEVNEEKKKNMVLQNKLLHIKRGILDQP